MPNRLFARMIAIAACALPMLCTGAASALVTPGADASGCAFQTVAFDSTSFVLAGDDTQTGGIDFQGDSDVCETITDGTGVGRIAGAMNGLIDSSLNGPVFTFFGVVTINGITHTIIETACVVIPTSIQPADTFFGVCAGLLTS